MKSIKLKRFKYASKPNAKQYWIYNPHTSTAKRCDVDKLNAKQLVGLPNLKKPCAGKFVNYRCTEDHYIVGERRYEHQLCERHKDGITSVNPDVYVMPTNLT
jgi:hypothetical protein